MRAFSLIALLCAFAIPIAGCGGDDDSGGGGSGSSSSSSGNTDTGGGSSASSGGGGAGVLKIAADPNGALKFDKTSLQAKSGKVTIVMTNTSSIPHAVELEGGGIEKKGAIVTGGGSVSRVTANLKPGKYEFYCPVDGHKAAGMKGTLTVS
ncbi:MAG TPA: plastocyanin/azurin family copper-binding protein [Thermoleophilaceae bacterium]